MACAEAAPLPILSEPRSGQVTLTLPGQRAIRWLFRDRCVFSSEIDIEDTHERIVNYENGVRCRIRSLVHAVGRLYRVF